MSPTEKPIITVPPHEVAATESGIASWRAYVTSLDVVRVGDGHHIVLRIDGIEAHRFRLNSDQSRHLASVLTSPQPEGTVA